MPFTPISSLPYPTNAESPDGASILQSIAETMDDICVPSFASSAARNTAIPSPQKGQLCYINVAGGGYQMNYDGTTGGWRYINHTKTTVLPADSLRTSTTTLANETPLVVSLPDVFSIYEVVYTLFFTGDTGVDVKFGFSSTGGIGTRMHFECLSGASTLTTGVEMTWSGAADAHSGLDTYVCGLVSPGGALRVRFVCATGASAGTLTFRWAQNVSSVLSSTMKAGSYVTTRRMAP